MKIERIDIPHAKVHLDPVTVRALVVLSSCHYDHACRQAGIGGHNQGWLMGWLRLANIRDKDVTKEVIITNRELDLVSKICEMNEPALKAKLITVEESAAIDKFLANINQFFSEVVK